MEAGKAVNILCKALMGQTGEDPSAGIEMVWKVCLSCSVLDHLIIMVQNDGEKM